MAFAKSKKGKLIIPVLLIVVLIIAAALLLGREESYRTISVSELSGNVTAETGGNAYAAYVNMNLQEGNALTTEQASYARMILDGDKYVRLEEESRAVFEGLGKPGSGHTVIHLAHGTLTSEITRPLREDESFVVNTPNAIMAVRGTFFRVSVRTAENGDVLTDVYVYDGTVNCRRILPDGKQVEEQVPVGEGYKITASMDEIITVYLFEEFGTEEDPTEPIDPVTIPDRDLVDMYEASLHEHEMFLPVEEIWEEIEERGIDLEEHSSQYDGDEISPYGQEEADDSDGTGGTNGTDGTDAGGTGGGSGAENAPVPTPSPAPTPAPGKRPETGIRPAPSASPDASAAPGAAATPVPDATPVPEVTPLPEDSPAPDADDPEDSGSGSGGTGGTGGGSGSTGGDSGSTGGTDSGDTGGDSGGTGGTVDPEPTPLTLDPDSLTLTAGSAGSVIASENVASVVSSDDNTAAWIEPSTPGKEVLIITGEPGTATLIVTGESGATATLTVTVTATPLTLDPDSLTLTVGESATVNASEDVASAVSSENSIASVSVSGTTITVYTHDTGVATITVTDAYGATATLTVTVTAAPLTLDPDSLTLTVGESATVTASGNVAGVSSDDNAVASATASGTSISVTAQGTGTAHITVTDDHGSTATITVTVGEDILTLDAEELIVTVGNYATLTATTGNVESWSFTSDPSMGGQVSMQEVGTGNTVQVTGLEVGAGIITATSPTGFRANCHVTINPTPADLAISPSELILTLGQDTTGTITVTGADPTTVTWDTSEYAVATVTPTATGAEVSAAGVTGTATIIATAQSGATATCQVTVVPPLVLEADSMTLTVGETGEIGVVSGGAITSVQSQEDDVVTAYYDEISGERKIIVEANSTNAGQADVVVTDEYGRTVIFTVTVEAALQMVAINDTNFPDDVFRAYVSQIVNSNGDGFLSPEEISACTEINLAETDVSDLTGIEYFSELIFLNCAKTKVSGELDMSHHPLLEALACNNTGITELNVRQNPALNTLVCCATEISELDVSSNLVLEALECMETNITELDVSKNETLYILRCYDNEIDTLDVTNNKMLEDLQCDSTKISELDLSENENLMILDCSNTYISQLYLQNKLYLQELACYNTNIDTLDVSQNPMLQLLLCNNTEISILNVQNNPYLVHLWCYRTNITSLNVSGFDYLSDLDVSYCPNLTSLNVTNCSSLTNLDISHTGLTSLSITGCTSLDQTKIIGAEGINITP